jgi:hypothetical protein
MKGTLWQRPGKNCNILYMLSVQNAYTFITKITNRIQYRIKSTRKLFMADQISPIRHRWPRIWLVGAHLRWRKMTPVPFQWLIISFGLETAFDLKLLWPQPLMILKSYHEEEGGGGEKRACCGRRGTWACGQRQDERSETGAADDRSFPKSVVWWKRFP